LNEINIDKPIKAKKYSTALMSIKELWYWLQATNLSCRIFEHFATKTRIQ